MSAMPAFFSTRALRLSFCIIALLGCGVSQVCAHGAYHEELQRVNEQLEASPNDGGLWYQRGWISFLHGDWQLSLTDLERAERLAPGRYPFDFVRGQALAAGQQFEAAKTVLDDFIKANPNHGPATAMRARVLEKMGLHEASLADFRAALHKKPEPEPDLYQEAAEALAARELDDQAVQVLQNGIERLGNIPSLVLKALDMEIRTHRFDAALLRVDAMQKAAPRPEPWMAKRASLLAQAGRTTESVTAWKALRDHIASLPNLQRGSNAMSQLTIEAEQALAALASLSSLTPAPANKTFPKP